MDSISTKRLELTQAVTSLVLSIRMEKGCQCCEFGQSVEDENRFFVIQVWDSRKSLIRHLKSEEFKVLRGAVNLFQKPGKEPVHRIFYPANRGSINIEEESLREL